MPVDDTPSNPSNNRPFHDVLAVSLSRRKMMAGSLAAATTLFVAPGLAGAGTGGQPGRNRPKRPQPLLGFTPSPNPGESPSEPSISPDYEYSVIIPWGTPLFAGVPELDPTNVAANTSANQEQQVGIGHDGMWLFPDGGSNERGVLCLNHEFGTNPHVLGKADPANLEEVRKSQAAHGITVVELANMGGTWQALVPAARNRRITVNTPVGFSGPAAGSALIQTPAGNAPAGTLNNCANGYTPWGTYLTCEENFNGYFGDSTYDPDTEVGEWTATAEQARYGFDFDGFGYGWYNFDPRFDLSDDRYVNEENRFGWIVEIDPNDPSAMPVKRTALGRLKHEGVALTVGRGGRVVGYMGDDQRFDYIYKFVSDRNWKSLRARGRSPLDEGTLYVARFDDDNTGEWLALTPDNPALAGWSMDEILVYARVAADAVGATPMDRPEWTTVGPNGDVFCTLTNNSRRGVPPNPDVDAANPEVRNPDGHIIRWRDADNHVGTTFEWDIYILAKNSRLENGGDESWEFTDPDGIWADPDGRLFVETDGGQPNDRNNQLLVSDTFTGEFRRLFAGVAGDEITGLTVTPDRRTLFCNTQHPGNGSTALTNFPIPGAGGPEVPRDATFVITRKDGGIIGS